MPIVDESRFWSKVERRGVVECWNWRGGITRRGYGHFWQGSKASGKKHRAHRIAWIIANGRPIPDGMMVMHSCDNRGCCNPSHLSVGTQQENIKDRDSKGRGKYFGTARNHPRPRAKLTEVSVREIRAIRGDHQTIARMFGVSAKTIGAVLRRDTWTHIT